ncbi:uncharacterized protein LOC107981899 isoform X1 [Nasonia vitripennis]|uniref:Uncharacterized protein n=1 Tax=Nasonia vitripennis TaxID=7425 RepID=A0A7M7TEK7_NASVI|nr:uncharacterized protein LOC107981899 isoform X1 [Nasonia vitripennis]XP_031785906.1 uncharacterized protein LOC107981899 isoform X1 [Nasonia vitripennis]XP_031785907.1 uncharacterized protein LOC107981899 isoform X1 [Nasonia vitripennis]XP_032457903.1 uncharacterized protein LOC107981899 isoform X1 [Nasonia vitripennis]
MSELDEEEFLKGITKLINLGDYNVNVSESANKEELYGVRILNQKQILHGIEDEDTGEYTFPKKPSSGKPTVVLRETSDGRKIPVMYNDELSTEESSESYAPCKYCFKYLKKSYMRKHKCDSSDRVTDAKGFLKECENLIPDIHTEASERLRNLVLKKMAPGEIKDIIKRDKCIFLYGNDLVDYYNKDHNYSMISHQLRILGDLVKNMRKRDKDIQFLEDSLKVDKVTLLCDVLKIMADHDVDTGLLTKVNKIPELTTLLKKVVKFFKAYYAEKKKKNYYLN